MPRLSIVIASTRPGRTGLPVAQWFIEQAKRHGGFELDIADLKELNLPLLDEPKHPRLGQYEQAHTKEWSARVTAADAFVFVTPEYNHAPPPALLNAIDFLVREWAYKPVGFVSYGGVSGGIRAVQILKQVMVGLKCMPLPEGVMLPFVANMMEDGALKHSEAIEKAAKLMLDELVRWSGALRTLR